MTNGPTCGVGLASRSWLSFERLHHVPAPRLQDGHPELGNATGSWFGPTIGRGTSDNLGGPPGEAMPEKVVEVPFLPWAKKAFDERRACYILPHLTKQTRKGGTSHLAPY